MYQLRNLINRRNIVKKPVDAVAACEDFIVLVTEAHILSAAMTLFGMKNLDDHPTEEYFPEKSEELGSLQRRNIFILATKHLVHEFVDNTIPVEKPGNNDPSSEAPAPKNVDCVLSYACDLLSNGLLLMELNDAIHEGDGNRIVRCWRYMFLIFKATNRTNYSIEAFTMLMQLTYLFSPRMVQQLKWNRTVNVHGREGKNISADLHMEHKNRECKTIISGMGPNVTEQSIQRVARALKPLSSTMLAFDHHNKVPSESDSHTRKSSSADMNKLVKQLFEDS